MVELCRSLVATPSEDPPGDTRAICSVLRQFLSTHGVAVEIYGPDQRRPNLVGQIVFGTPGPNVVFNGHMETLPVGDRSRWAFDPFGATISDGRIYGRGTACMKGGIAGLVFAALSVGEHGGSLVGAITLAFVSDEVNGGGLGTGFLIDHVPAVRGDAALIGEGGPGINIAHNGVAFIEFRTEGTGGHGATGYAHTSAIHRMMALLDEVRRLESTSVSVPPDIRARINEVRVLTDAVSGQGTADALMRLSVNVGTVHGGQKVNVIAEACTAEVDFRLPFSFTVQELLSRVQDIVDRHEGVTFRVLWANEPTASAPAHPWFRQLQQTSRDLFGEPLPFGYSVGFTDARFFRMKDIPAAALGMRGRGVGAPDEHIEIEQLCHMAELCAAATFEYLHPDGRR